MPSSRVLTAAEDLRIDVTDLIGTVDSRCCSAPLCCLLCKGLSGPFLLWCAVCMVGILTRPFVPQSLSSTPHTELQKQVDRLEGEAKALRARLSASKAPAQPQAAATPAQQTPAPSQVMSRCWQPVCSLSERAPVACGGGSESRRRVVRNLPLRMLLPTALVLVLTPINITAGRRCGQADMKALDIRTPGSRFLGSWERRAGYLYHYCQR